MIKCTTCGLTRERFLHRHQVNPEHQAKMYLRETCVDKSSCKFEIIPDEPNSEDLLKAQLSRSLPETAPITEGEINSLLACVWRESWMDDADWSAFCAKIYAKPGFSVKKIQEDFRQGVENGYSVDQQIQICKSLFSKP